MEQKSTKDRILSGVDLIANTVKVTLGTKGRLVMYLRPRDMEDPFGEPIMTKDGVTVAKQIESQDEIERMTIHVVRQAAQNTVQSSGDGTTTTTILTQQIVSEGAKLLKSGTVSSYEFNKEADLAVDNLVEYIQMNSMPVTNVEMIKQVATISSNSEEIGQLIYDIISEVGLHSDIEVKKSRNSTTEVELVKGMKLHKGYFAPFFCSDTDKMEWVEENVNILIFDDVIRDYSDIASYIRVSVDSEGKPLPILIYCQDVANTVLNRIQGMLQYNPRPFMIVEHDGFGDRRVELLNDLSIITGGVIVDSKSKINPSKALGQCAQVRVTQKHSSFLGGKSDEKDRLAEIENIQRKLELADLSDNERKFYNKRLANLHGGVAVIHVGGNTVVEMEEEYYRIEDAVLAVSAASKAGICIGGGFTWERACEYAHTPAGYSRQTNPAYYVVRDSVRSILKQLLTNSQELHKLEEVRRNAIDLSPKAYNLIDRKFYDITEYPVYDASSVLIDSITNATSVAKSLLAIERAVVNGVVYE